MVSNLGKTKMLRALDEQESEIRKELRELISSEFPQNTGLLLFEAEIYSEGLGVGVYPHEAYTVQISDEITSFPVGILTTFRMYLMRMTQGN